MNLIGCSILSDEINSILAESGSDHNVLYIDAALHVNLDLLEQAIKSKLKEAGAGEPVSLLVGSKCHPEIKSLVEQYNSKIVSSSNCIELLLGGKMAEMDREAKTFYITNGWLKRWRDIFIEGLKWDNIDARQNFGYYDRIILIDTGLTEVRDEDILEFFEYTQIPIEIYSTGLEYLKTEISSVL